VKTPNCRLAFHGRLAQERGFKDKDWMTKVSSNLKIYKHRRKQGVVERANNETEVICK